MLGFFTFATGLLLGLLIGFIFAGIMLYGCGAHILNELNDRIEDLEDENEELKTSKFDNLL